MTYLDDIAAQMADFFRQNARPITYEGRTVLAVQAGTQWHDIEKVKETFGVMASSRDYICKRTDFPEGSEPKPKDIIEDHGTRWKVYQLSGEECWRPLGGETTGLIRIHCKK
ncbi:MAG: hypothetical protein IJQ31_14940 [Thermoguttaceae bacterium]|nr:hypothetical protein [Thermoguttaceae bacterium]